MDSSAALISLLAPLAGERILDLGCGIGENTARIAESGAHSAGIDILGVLLEQARYKFPDLEFVEADFLHWTPSAAFDGVYAHAVLEWIQPPEKALKRVKECLKPGGRLAAMLGGANETARQLEGYYEPSPEEYQKVLKKSGFAAEVCERSDGVLFVLARRPR